MAVAFFSAALFLRFWIFLAISSIIVTTQYLPDSQSQITDELERLLVDTGGINDSVFKSGITPCSNYVDGSTGRNNNTLGRQTAAAWIRTAFRKAYISLLSFGAVHSLLAYFTFLVIAKICHVPYY